MGNIGGQASGGNLLNQGALRILYSVNKDSIPSLADDGFTQSNPPVVKTLAAVSTTLPTNVKNGVLGGSVAFVRPDAGENTVGGAVQVGGVFVAKTRPLGLFINDAEGNANENTPGPASGKGPFLRGGAAGVKIYETAVQTTLGGGVVGTALTYSEGDFVYGSVNGYLTNRWQDSLEAAWIAAGTVGSGAAGAPIEPDTTRMGVVIAPPGATSSEMFVELKY